MFVRQYASTDPTVTVSPASSGLPQSITFTSCDPSNPTVGGTSYTVTAKATDSAGFGGSTSFSWCVIR